MRHSQSSCKEYERCPRRYRFAYVDRAPTLAGLHASWAEEGMPLADLARAEALVCPARTAAIIAAIDDLAATIAADTEFAPRPGLHCGSCVWAHLRPSAVDGPVG